MKLSITKKIETTEEIDITEPMFFREKTKLRHLAVIEESIISLFRIDGIRTNIVNAATEDYKTEIAEAISTWDKISEEEFFEALGKALKDFDFKPTLKVIKQLNESDQERKMLQGNY